MRFSACVLPLLCCLLLACGDGGSSRPVSPAGPAAAPPSANSTAAPTAPPATAPSANPTMVTKPPMGLPPSSDLGEACRNLLHRYDAYLKSVSALSLPVSFEESYVASCQQQATLPGSTITVADLDACQASPLLGYGLPCLDYHGTLLFPDHTRPGTLPAGSVCKADVQCDSGYCSGSYLDDRCGVCQTFRQIGEACSSPADACPAKASCTGGICSLFGTALGKACNTYGGGDCQETLFCRAIKQDSLDGTCELRAPVGGNCDQDTPCSSGFLCLDKQCTAPLPEGASCPLGWECAGRCQDGLCVAVPSEVFLGEDCTFSSCAFNLQCSGEHRCEMIPIAQKGELCSGKKCAVGLICDHGYKPDSPTLGQCTDPPAPGEACISFECEASSSCNNQIVQWGICEPKGFVGEPGPCVEGLVWGKDKLCHAHHEGCP